MSHPSTATLDPALRGAEHVEQLQTLLDWLRSGAAGEGVPAFTVAGQRVSDETSGFDVRTRTDDVAEVIYLHKLNGRPNSIVPAVVTASGTTVITRGGDTHIFVNTTAGAVVIELPDLTAEGAVPMFVHVVHIAGTNLCTVIGDGQAIGQYPSGEGVLLPKIGDYVSLWAAPDEWATWQFYNDASRGVREVSASGAVRVTDALLLVDTSGGAAVMTLPPAADYQGPELVVKQINGAAGVSLDPDGSEEIDNLGAGVAHVIAAQNEVARLRTDGTQWWIV